MKFLLLRSLLIIIGCRLCRSKVPANSFPRVVTRLGTIEGLYNTSSEGKLYEAYLGIPYAKAITKNQRFEIAEPVAPWTGVLSAKAFGSVCSQIDINSAIARIPKVIGSEDCLRLNVYTPAAKYRSKIKASSDLLPVIIFIHGGSFRFRSAADYRPDYLLDKPVIFVTPNYRLGPLGFLSTEDDTVPGNNGLKDQVLAMRWVKNNILSFGGNPNNITLIGQTAGAASVHFHYLTDVTKGLFQRGMSVSGNALMPVAQTEGSLEKAKKLATIVRCPSNDVRKMVTCLKTRTAEEITKATLNFTVWLNTPIAPFGPVVEKGKGNSTLIKRSPIDSIVSGNVQDVPWVMAAVSEEGFFPAAFFLANPKLLKELNNDWKIIAPYLLDFNYTIPKSDQNEISQCIRKHYFGKKPIDDSTVQQIVRMLTDRWFGYDSGKAAKLQALAVKSPIRFSYFSYKRERNATELFFGKSTNEDNLHFDDYTYLMNAPVDAPITPRDRQVRKILINSWVSYARDGVPDLGVSWPGVNTNPDELRYLHIAGPDDIHSDESTNFANKDFWQSLPFRENIVTKKFTKN